jgi:hypothetical protein
MYRESLEGMIVALKLVWCCRVEIEADMKIITEGILSVFLDYFKTFL